MTEEKAPELDELPSSEAKESSFIIDQALVSHDVTQSPIEFVDNQQLN